MSKSELKKEFDAIVKKAIVQKDLFLKKLGSVDVIKAVKDPSEYEGFMPSLDSLAEDLDAIHNDLYKIMEELNAATVNMYDAVESSFEKSEGDDAGEEEEGSIDDSQLEEGDEDNFNPSEDEPAFEIESKIEYPEES